MKTLLTLAVTLTINFVVCRDFYVGMFKFHDILVAQDRLYKERVPFRRQIAKYGRYFKCPITYYRIVDRLGVGVGPTVKTIRGGLRHNFLVLKIVSAYNKPISVNVYVGCENKMPTTVRTKATTTGSGGGNGSTGSGGTGGSDATTGSGTGSGASDGSGPTDNSASTESGASPDGDNTDSTGESSAASE